MSNIGPDVAVALIQGAAGGILMQQRSADNAQYPGWWEFPGGKQEPGETLIETLRREVMEEVGVVVYEAGHLVTCTYEFPNKKTHTVHFFYVPCSSHGSKMKGDVGMEGQPLRWGSLESIHDDTKVLPLNRMASLLLQHKLSTQGA